MAKTGGRRSLFVPEVVQTSSMDCGPASLKSLLEGFGISASYGRLREACQTDVDGTSIDTIEQIATQLGLDAEQVIVPVDHLLLDEAGVLPALIVVKLPIGFTHFVVVWRTLAGLVEIMDPATGRRWPSREAFLGEVYLHKVALPSPVWRAYAASDAFLDPLRVRMRGLGADGVADTLIEGALADPGWQALATLDASVRMVNAVVKSGGLSRGGEASAALQEILRRAHTHGNILDVVPARYCFARATPSDEDGEEMVLVSGALLVQVRGKSDSRAAPDASAASVGAPEPLSPELVAALEEPPAKPFRELAGMLREDGVLAPSSIILGVALAGSGTVLEAVLLRSLFDLGRYLHLTDKRLWAIAGLLIFLLALAFLDVPIATGALRMGRRLEGRLRMAFLRKIPRLSSQYFQSRPVSDMADRSHVMNALRGLPGSGVELLRSGLLLLFTTIGVAWLDPRSAPIAVLVAVTSVALPLGFQRWMTERDLRVRSHAAALSRIYLDALLGLVSIRAHGAEASVRREHESLLVEWVHASRARDRLAMGTDVLQSILGFALTGVLFLWYFSRVREPGAALLLLYWAVSLPSHGQALALVLRQLPGYRNVALRLLEPLGALEQNAPDDSKTGASAREEARGGAAVRLENVSVRVGGHTILEDVSLDVAPGTQLAIVGASGAGKSSLVALLLGWHRPASGEVLVDGEALVGRKLQALREETAWVDPAVQLWNRPLIDNLVYGAKGGAEARLGEVVEYADLHGLLETLPEGLATELGESGGLVSGGEGQRVRFGRGALRTDARLVILDEPFRGLDRERRRELLARARRWWKGATLLCITHDVRETSEFDRVVVVDRGKIVEDGAPARLTSDERSRYAAMLAAEDDVCTNMWGDPTWRRFHLEGGVLAERRVNREAECAPREPAA